MCPQATFVLSSPAYLTIAMEHERFQSTDLSSVKQYTCGGSVLSANVRAKIRKHLVNGDIYTSYGLTETAGVVSKTSSSHNGSVGQLAPGIQAIIIDENDGHRCGVNEHGEIRLKNIYPLLGYFQNAESTRAACDADGWLLTGDIGYFDEHGDMYLVDRKNEIFKYKGFQVAPAEIESLLIDHPMVEQACVVGVPCLKSNFLPTALIVAKPYAGLNENDVLEFSEGKLCWNVRYAFF